MRRKSGFSNQPLTKKRKDKDVLASKKAAKYFLVAYFFPTEPLANEPEKEFHGLISKP